MKLENFLECNDGDDCHMLKGSSLGCDVLHVVLHALELGQTADCMCLCVNVNFIALYNIYN